MYRPVSTSPESEIARRLTNLAQESLILLRRQLYIRDLGCHSGSCVGNVADVGHDKVFGAVEALFGIGAVGPDERHRA